MSSAMLPSDKFASENQLSCYTCGNPLTEIFRTAVDIGYSTNTLDFYDVPSEFMYEEFKNFSMPEDLEDIYDYFKDNIFSKQKLSDIEIYFAEYFTVATFLIKEIVGRTTYDNDLLLRAFFRYRTLMTYEEEGMSEIRDRLKDHIISFVESNRKTIVDRLNNLKKDAKITVIKKTKTFYKNDVRDEDELRNIINDQDIKVTNRKENDTEVTLSYEHSEVTNLDSLDSELFYFFKLEDFVSTVGYDMYCPKLDKSQVPKHTHSILFRDNSFIFTKIIAFIDGMIKDRYIDIFSATLMKLAFKMNEINVGRLCCRTRVLSYPNLNFELRLIIDGKNNELRTEDFEKTKDFVGISTEKSSYICTTGNKGRYVKEKF